MSDKEIWSGPATEPDFGANIGETLLVNVHSIDKCAGRACCLHAPSAHHMRDWPTLFRADMGYMERICPCGVGHPDFDDIAYWKSQGKDISIHGCCGICCTPPEDR